MVSKKGTKTGPRDKTCSKTSSLVSVAGFLGIVPVAVPGWFLFLLWPFRLRPSEMVSVTPKPGSCYSPHPESKATVHSICPVVPRVEVF